MHYLLLVLILLAPGLASAAENDRVKLDVAPGQVSLIRSVGEAVAIVTAAVPDGLAVKVFELSVVEPRGIKASIEPLGAPGSGDRSWKVTIKADALAAAEVAIPVRLVYAATPGNAGREALASIKGSVAPNPETAITVKLESGFQVLTERSPGDIRLVLDNKSGEAVRVTNVSRAFGPDFLEFNFKSAPETVVPAYGTTVIVGSVQLGNAKRYSPRAHPVTLRVEMAGAWGTQPFEKLADVSIEVGVPGLGDALKAFALPSLLLLPGLLTLVAAAWLKARLWQSALPADWTSPPFWVAAITTSGFIAWFIFEVWNYDISDKYRLQDVVGLWALSLTFFPLLYLLVTWIVGWLMDAAAARVQAYVRRRFLSASDSPPDVLRKIAHRKSSFYLRSFPWERRGRRGRVFELPGFSEAADKTWIVPGAVLEGPLSPENARRVDGWLDQPLADRALPRAFNARGMLDLRSRWQRLKDGVLGRQGLGPSTRWETDVIAGPMEVKRATLDKIVKREAAPRSFLRRGRSS
ncbi:MAG TPA: hypothetical protein VF601_00630 [Beijerinckiaceae bacterium]|jgi:hypothetical protein